MCCFISHFLSFHTISLRLRRENSALVLLKPLLIYVYLLARSAIIYHTFFACYHFFPSSFGFVSLAGSVAESKCAYSLMRIDAFCSSLHLMLAENCACMSKLSTQSHFLHELNVRNQIRVAIANGSKFSHCKHFMFFLLCINVGLSSVWVSNREKTLKMK